MPNLPPTIAELEKRIKQLEDAAAAAATKGEAAAADAKTKEAEALKEDKKDLEKKPQSFWDLPF